ncbi:MAG: 1-deoxy-D-xylulose-5-phosphate reductoisomerase [Desulfatiglandaceae bacterium]
MKNITILGSTGSIGVQALKVIERHPDHFRLVALGAGKNIALLQQQVKKFNPLAVAVRDERLAGAIAQRFSGTNAPMIFSGTQGLIQLVRLDQVDTVISAMSGAAGLLPSFSAIQAGKDLALANKETMVMAGDLVMREAKRQGVAVLPIDSEHSAILQALQGHCRDDLRRVVLTASGGPFRSHSAEQLKNVTLEETLNHPNWQMGPKITVDSATLMNKGLEAIEAKWFFDLDMDQISILIHPQSIVHSMVEYRDGSTVAQLGVPDMMIPISYALTYPRHYDNDLFPLSLETVGTITFEKPDLKKFRCLALALDAASIGQSMPTVLNAANEVAVSEFLAGRIRFLQIAELVEKTMAQHVPYPVEAMESVMEADRWGREKAGSLLSGLC